MKRIVLIGFVCSYKSSTGKKLARLLNVRHYDTDTMVENKCQLTVGKIIQSQGIDYFRQQEEAVCQRLASSNCVVSCGGGTVTVANNMDRLCRNSIVIWLSTSLNAVQHRLQHSNRPRPLQDDIDIDALASMLAERNELYSHYADITISTDEATSSQLANTIAIEVQQLYEK